MDLKGILILPIYTALFMAVFVAVVAWDRRKRRTRKPFGENVKLLRMPGEHLWRQVIEKDASEIYWTFGLMVLPIFAAWLALQIAAHFFNKSYVGFVVAIVVFVFVMLLCIRWLVARLQRRQNEYLGFFGERFVADCLEPLKENGWFVFHDIQCDGATGKFNLDHVAVGPGGIWVVETKTRRKGRARPDMDPGKVVFDGAKIIWPWWNDSTSIKQAANNSNWLRDWLEKMTERKFDVSAVIAIPGYKVEAKSRTGVRVVAPEDLQDVLVGYGKTILSAEDIRMIRLQLAAKCRDVEF
ncbi:MAG TPA: nuclease-related domain-containing protein [Candidatus Sulfotelmatobacter sp.]|nr:nuclease-related domain-containing protein [Candidatus Sulfotelmatobacter sp.]